MEQEYIYATLPSGLRVVARHRAGAPVEHCGVAVNAGSRDEKPGQSGLAHFVEHTIFKGTKRRRAWHILNRMETVGGELNAYTTKEETMLYTTAPSGNLDRMLDLVADLITDSTFPQSEIDLERQVVADEIDSYLDIPSEGIFDDFEELIFDGSPMAHNILGCRKDLDTLDTMACREWLEQFYTPGEMVLFYSGPTSPDRFIAKASAHFGTLDRCDRSRTRISPAILPAFDITRSIASHQAHCVMGTRVPGLSDTGRHTLALLTNLLGGPGMNSLLNVSLREKRGLVYTIDASSSLLTDCGLFTIYFGCDPEDVRRCSRLARNVIERLATTPLSTRRLDQAKRQYTGQLTIASTNTEQNALSMARSTLYRGHADTASETIGNIQAVTPTQIRDYAERLLPLSRLVLL